MLYAIFLSLNLKKNFDEFVQVYATVMHDIFPRRNLVFSKDLHQILIFLLSLHDMIILYRGHDWTHFAGSTNLYL